MLRFPYEECEQILGGLSKSLKGKTATGKAEGICEVIQDTKERLHNATKTRCIYVMYLAQPAT